MPVLAPPRRARAAPTLVAPFALLLATTPAAAQLVRGTVIDVAAGTPIAYAEVALVDQNGQSVLTALTDSLGVFLLEAPNAGRYTLTVRHIGFVAVSTPVVDVSDAEMVSVEVRMSAEAITLDPLVVVQRRWYGIARLEQFYDRADWHVRTGIGRIYFHEDLQSYSSLRHLFMTVPRRLNCPMPILVDGIPIHSLDDLDAFAQPSDVEGVEIYRGAAQVPPEYAHLTDCAIALVWTRPTRGNPFSWKRFLVGVAAAGVLVFFMVR